MRGTIQNRDRFLNNIAKRLQRDSFRTELERPIWKHHPQDDVLKGASTDELIEVLKKQCETIHTKLVVTTKDELVETMKEEIFAYGGGPVVAWNDERFEQFGLSPLFMSVLPEEKVDVHIWDPEKGEENIDSAEKANIGITISDITLAESATAVLFSDKNRVVPIASKKYSA